MGKLEKIVPRYRHKIHLFRRAYEIGWQASREFVQQMSKNSHEVHVNAYHVSETRIREGAGPHLLMPASTRPTWHNLRHGHLGPSSS